MALKKKLRMKGWGPVVGSPPGFAPFQPPARPPVGTYDPNIDAQERAAVRGFGYTQEDATTNRGYLASDYELNKGQLADSLKRTQQDLGTSRARAVADYGTAVAALGRRYTQLGAAQAQGAQAAGVAQGGTLAAALRARNANQGLEQQSLDTSQQRFLADNALAGDRAQTSYDQRLGGLGVQFRRANQAIDTGEQRAGTELGAFKTDASTVRFAQAGQAGYSPPQGPANEFTDAKGPYRLILRGKKRYRMRPGGQLEPA